MNPSELTQSLKAEAKRLGFQLTGACPAVSPVGFDQFSQWLDAGYAGEMHYLEERKEAYKHPGSVMEGVASILMLGMNYQTDAPNLGSSISAPASADSSDAAASTDSNSVSQPGFGRIALYAWGTADYHDVIHKKLKQLKKFVGELDENIKVRGVVDTAPLMEREFAQLAGLGWKAKNTLLINKHNGSWFLLAALLLDAPLQYDSPVESDHCGTCTACLSACPTDAFVSAGVLDATKCISYLTIEHRSPIPIELRPLMGNWILGCDICQEVCPWNNKAPLGNTPSFEPIKEHNPIQLRELFELTDDQFRSRFRKTPLWRPKRRGILRNAAIAMGNDPDDANLSALSLGLKDPDPLVRGASAWALGFHSVKLAKIELKNRHKIETNPVVKNEIWGSLIRIAEK